MDDITRDFHILTDGHVGVILSRCALTNHKQAFIESLINAIKPICPQTLFGRILLNFMLKCWCDDYPAANHLIKRTAILCTRIFKRYIFTKSTTVVCVSKWAASLSETH